MANPELLPSKVIGEDQVSEEVVNPCCLFAICNAFTVLSNMYSICGFAPCTPTQATCVQQAKKLCRDIMKAVQQLQDKRDMSINECKLTIAIEDPRSRERREALGIEVSMYSS